MASNGQAALAKTVMTKGQNGHILKQANGMSSEKSSDERPPDVKVSNIIGKTLPLSHNFTTSSIDHANSVPL